MDPQEFQRFSNDYSPLNFDRICFKWNGKYGDELQDPNMEFRVQLTEYLIPKLSITSLELIKDLYLEFGKSSEATFGCYQNFHLLGQELLERGGISYLEYYLQGAMHTMDTAGMSSRISLSKTRAKELLELFDEKLANPANKNESKLFDAYFRSRFEREANKI